MSEHDHQETKRKIEEGQKKRMRLREKKAAAEAQKKEAQKKLKALKDKAEEEGYVLQELPDVIERKEEQLEDEVESWLQKLDESEEKMAKYEQ